MSEHVCACFECRSDLVPTGGRRGEHHAAVRFGDHGPEWIVKLDGELIEHKAFEVLAGDPGWILCYSQDPGSGRLHFCRTCGSREPCVQRLEGRVQVTRQPLVGRAS